MRGSGDFRDGKPSMSERLRARAEASAPVEEPDEVADAPLTATEVALQAGLEVLGRELLGTLDPRAVRTIPAHFGAVAVGLVDGFLVVAFPSVPNPTVVQEIGATVGIPLRLVVVPGELFDELGAEAARKREFVPVELDAILADAAARHASDVHLAAGSVPIARVRGTLVPLEGWPLLSAEDTRELARTVAGDVVSAPEWSGDLQTAVSLGGRRLRASIYRQRQAHALALRILPARVPRLEDLGLPRVLEDVAAVRTGLVIVSGLSGSGTSSTLAAIVDRINERRHDHVVTIERPVEFVHGSRQATIHQREVGVDVPSFAEGLRTCLRQDPDVVVVSDLADAEAIEAALRVAETGQLVVAEVRAPDARAAVQRLVDAFPPDRQAQVRAQLAYALQAVVCQTLLPRAGDADARVAVCEVLLASSAVREAVRSGSPADLAAALLAGADAGMQPHDVALALAVVTGRVDEVVARGVAHDPAVVDGYVAELRRASA
jgi:twitching motility protein PilT